MSQQWDNLLFAHWHAAPELLQKLVPRALEIDTYGGAAWLGVVPFEMRAVRFRWLPPIPTTSQFPELNVRTYVRHRGKPGVWFFSLDAASTLAVAGARLSFHLPYFRARMNCEEKSGSIEYASRRTHRGAPPAELQATYRSTSATFNAAPGSLDYFVAERYCLFAADKSGRIFSAEIHHPPWSLQRAEAQFTVNTMVAPLGIAVGNPDTLHFSRRQDVIVWPLKAERVRGM